MKTQLDDLREAVLAGAKELAGAGAHDGGVSRGGELGGEVSPGGVSRGGKVGGEVSPGGAARRPALFGRAEAITLERPPKPELGDYATNAALLMAPSLGVSARELAERLGAVLAVRLGPGLRRYEVAGPGFLNLFVSDSWLRGALAGALAAGDTFGSGGAERRERILVEFVSANPTGPMHVGHARNAAYGDSLARVLAFHGHQVEREFYVNDAGSQVRAFGESIRALARGEEAPEDGYRGDYVHALAGEIEGAARMEPAALGRAAVELMVAHIQASLRTFAVEEFDHWQYESALHAGSPSPVEHALKTLEEHGHTYTSEGALWLRTTDYGDDKDRVLVRSSGEHTYFASDIAYHLAKRERGFERQIDVWGADHHGYTARMRAAYAALGGDPAHLEMLIMQLVHLMRRGERAQMSKRAGEFVTLDELMAEIGADAARWFLLSRSHDTTIDLDLDLAREQSKENPVYYVQYAHARIVSVLELAGAQRVAGALAEVERAAGTGERANGPGPGKVQTGEVANGPGLGKVRTGEVANGPGLGKVRTGECANGPGREEARGGARAVGETPGGDGEGLHPAERALIKRLLAFPAEVAEAAQRRAPHRIATYALELAQDFTGFYESCRIVGIDSAEAESLRLALAVATQRTIARCLGLLGVSAPLQM